VTLTETLTPSRVATHLRLGGADLKKQIALRHGALAPAAPIPVGFVEVPSVRSALDAVRGVEVELQRRDGARLRIQAPATATLPLDAIVHSFLEAH
jgi:hypothetical protein